MAYAPNLLEEILRRTDIVQLVGRRVKLTRKGQAFWGCCPFHGEKTASFKVENARRTYKCFGCGKGGDAFKWLMETEGLSFPEAVEKLASEAGVELPKWSPEDEARAEKKKSLYDVIEAAAKFFEEQLAGTGGKAARDYLKGRAMDEATAKKFRLGYAPATGSALIGHLTTLNVTMDDMIAAGLARPADEHHGTRDFFFNRLMFPISDARGRVIAFGGRGLSADAKPKYINTGETEFFSKGRQLYNFHLARPAGIKAQTIIVCEGYMDVIALAKAGFEASVAPLGTALTEDQLHLLWKVAPEPVCAFDGDAAGKKAALRAAHLALPHLKPGHSLRFAFIPGDDDPDSLIRSLGPGAMQKVLDAAEPLADVLWKSETEGKDLSTPERRAGLERTLADIVAQVSDAKIAEYYRRDFDGRVFDAFKRRPKRQDRSWTPRAGREGRSAKGGDFGRNGRFQGPPEGASEALKASLIVRQGGPLKVKEMEVLRLALAEPELAARHAETLASLPFSDLSLDRLRAELLNVAASGSRLEKQGLENHLNRRGMADIVARLKAPREGGEGTASGEDTDARFLRAASQLRDMAEIGPEQKAAWERFKREPTEEHEREALRFREDRSGE
jgi:DNA primase